MTSTRSGSARRSGACACSTRRSPAGRSTTRTASTRWSPRRSEPRARRRLRRRHERRADFEPRSEEHTSELQSRGHLVCRLLLEKINNKLLYIIKQLLFRLTLIFYV